MHPGARILLAILSALALPGLSFFYLLILSFILLLFSWRQPGRVLRLIHRSRWLLLGLILVYAYQLPGAPLLAGWDWSPSQAGLQAGLVQAWRLVLLLLLIDGLVLRLPLEALLAGLVSLAYPLRAVGVPVEAAVVRLGLTLHALAHPPAPSGHKGLLPDVDLASGKLPDRFVMKLHAWRWPDGLSLLLATLTTGWIWLVA